MLRLGVERLLTIFMVALLANAPAGAQTANEVNEAELQDRITAAGGIDPVMVKAQILLDRAYYSPGVIDGIYGSNTKKALREYQLQRRLTASGTLDAATWEALTGDDDQPALMSYTLAKEDVDGPFVDSIPAGMKEMAKLERLAYTSASELLAEKFHMGERLLRALNPDVDFGKSGAEITVARVRKRRPGSRVATILVDKVSQTVKPLDASGKLIAFYPATVGSRTFPSPDGVLKVTAVAERPTFTYSSELAYSDLPKGERLVIPPGPNNPVGIVWISLSKNGFGIHGTPQPEKISKSASHGCVRLTNWDALELAHLVSSGVTVQFSN
ncbi:MAG: L,D-transpeptidase family protein [Actinomycetota bacterium]